MNLVWKEQHLYGSNRLGMWVADEEIINEVPDPYLETVIGTRHYELTNHLGNVLTVVTDKKTYNGNYWEAEVINVSDYYPFGMLMPGRSYAVDASYRYGFNGKENDNEVKGEGNQQDYGMRIYDPRLGRFLSVDPLTKEYPWNSTYAFAENDVVRSVDLDGLEKYFKIDGTVLGTNVKGENGVLKVATEYTIEEKYIIVSTSIELNSSRTLNARDQGETQVKATGITKLSNSDIGRILAFGKQVIRNNKHYLAPTTMTALEESIGTIENGNYGLLDFKYVAYDLLNIPSNNLIEIDGIAYNANEAGNFLWAMVLIDNGTLVNPAWAANQKSLEGPEARPDEANEQRAINAGIQYAKNLPTEVDKTKKEFRGGFLTRLFGASTKATEDVKRVIAGARDKLNQDGQQVNRTAPNGYSGN